MEFSRNMEPAFRTGSTQKLHRIKSIAYRSRPRVGVRSLNAKAPRERTNSRMVAVNFPLRMWWLSSIRYIFQTKKYLRTNSSLRGPTTLRGLTSVSLASAVRFRRSSWKRMIRARWELKQERWLRKCSRLLWSGRVRMKKINREKSSPYDCTASYTEVPRRVNKVIIKDWRRVDSQTN